MEQGFTDDAPLFPVFERHNLTLHSVMELHDAATLPVDWARTDLIYMRAHHRCRRVGNTPSGQCWQPLRCPCHEVKLLYLQQGVRELLEDHLLCHYVITRWHEYLSLLVPSLVMA